MKEDPDNVDLFFGDDNNYVKLPGNGETAYGVEIGTNVGSAYTWRFGTDGNLTFPNGDLTIGHDPYGNPAIIGAAGKNIAMIASGVGDGYEIGSSLIWVDSITEPTKIAGVTANNPLFAGAGDVGIVTGDYFYTGTTNVWNFGADGTLTAPGNVYVTGNLFIQGNTYQNDRELFVSSAGEAIEFANGGNIFAPADLGNIVVSTNTSQYNWTYGDDGELYLPTGGRLGFAGKGWTGLDGGFGAPTSLTSYYSSGMYSSCVTPGPIGIVQISTYSDGEGLTNTWNFDANGINFLDDSIQATAWTGSVANIGNVAPTGVTAVSGSAWYNTNDGRTYIKYGSQWVDASPTVTPAPSYYLGNLTVDGDVIDFTYGNLTIDSTGTLLVNGTEVAGSGTGNVSFNNTMLVTEPGTNVGWDHGIISIAPGNYIGSGQYINIYPTQAYDEPHIHIAAGIDNGGGDLILGPDEYHVDVNHNGNIYVRTNGQANQWEFGADGNLTLPTGGNINYANGHSILSGITSGTNTGNITFSGSDITGLGSNVTLTADTTDWVFYANANLVLPTNATITYANGTSILDGNIIFNANSSVSVSGVDGNVQIVTAGTSIWNFGTDGTTSLPGGIATKDNLTIGVSGIPNAVTGLTGSPTGGWSGSYTNLSTSGGSGTGLTVNASESGSGYIDTVTINTPGHGYTNGDTIAITSGGATAYFTISMLPAKNWTFDGYGNLTFPDSTRQTTAYAGPQIRQTTVTLTPADLAGLNSYPGKTLVSAAGLTSNQVIVVTALEFSLTYNTTPYTTTANLYLNYSGNYLTVAQAIPAGNTTANNNVGMLTSSRNTYRYVQNGMVDGDFPPQQDVILMSDGAISNGDSDLRVKVTYIITTLF